MRALPAGLSAHLKSGATTVCRCWRLRLKDGSVEGFTDHDRDLAFGGVIHRSAAGLLQTSDVARADFGVGGSEIAGALTSAGLNETDLAAGVYDGAAVELWIVNWSDVSERMLVRSGTIGEVVKADAAFRAEVRGPMHALSAAAGRVFAAGCDAALGDHRCKVTLEDPSLSTDGVVGLVDGDRRFRADGLSGFGPGAFTGGGVTFTLGENAGARLAVKLHTVGTAGVFLELRDAPRFRLFPGDRFTATVGCDKRFETCRDTFGNSANFRGFPHIPGNDRALGYAGGAGGASL